MKPNGRAQAPPSASGEDRYEEDAMMKAAIRASLAGQAAIVAQVAHPEAVVEGVGESGADEGVSSVDALSSKSVR
jgi:hypothetical protein